MEYTVQKLARLAGISVRTLHYYDQIGLLKPSFVKENGYRYYGEGEVDKLQQILFFRELQFPLEKISQIMTSQYYDKTKVLDDQKKMLELKKAKLEKLLETINKTSFSLKGGESMSNDDKFSVFNDPSYSQYKDEVEEKWGNTEAFRQSRERVGKMSKEEFEKVKALGSEITLQVASLMKQGEPATGKMVQEQMERYYKYLFSFYDPNPEMFAGLGQMYIDDVRFTKFYEKIAPGLAVFMRDGMKYYAEQKTE